MTRPRIGVTGPDKGGWPAWFFTSNLVRFAGGMPVRITPSRKETDFRPLHGLIIGGGADVSPGRYRKAPVVSATPAPACEGPPKKFVFSAMLAFLVKCLRIAFRVQSEGVDLARDELEFELLAEVEKQGTPILGICRGEQLMNVHRGGSLHTELSAFYVQEANPHSVRPVKKVSVKSNSRLRKIFSSDDCTVNSLHSQAVADLGDGVQVSAVDSSGVIQAIEKAPSFWLGVQWHPEYMPQSKLQRQLFRSLVCHACESSVANSREPG